jgi:hypothetical protein
MALINKISRSIYAMEDHSYTESSTLRFLGTPISPGRVDLGTQRW